MDSRELRLGQGGMIATARTRPNLAPAVDILQWCATHGRASGALAVQEYLAKWKELPA